MALAVYSVLARGGGNPNWVSTAPGESAEVDSCSGIFGEGCGVQTGKGQEVKCLQGPLGLCPSHPLLQMLLDVQTGLSKACPATRG